ncbi:hypothetical protein [Nocardia brasiliensis]|uniref:hypothetical protein n=1 Tax=Nocardia brasiliensis TaxID=37326 RepID=UPI002453954F|nr:hypothetical protein [Nocardia brasiliensis]
MSAQITYPDVTRTVTVQRYYLLLVAHGEAVGKYAYTGVADRSFSSDTIRVDAMGSGPQARSEVSYTCATSSNAPDPADVFGVASMLSVPKFPEQATEFDVDTQQILPQSWIIDGATRTVVVRDPGTDSVFKIESYAAQELIGVRSLIRLPPVIPLPVV